MIKTHTNQSGIVYQVYGRARIADKSTKIYVGSFATRREAERADHDHQARQRLVADGELPAASDPKRTLGTSITEWLAMLAKRSPNDRGHRSRSEYESRIRNHVPAALTITPLGKVTTAKLETLQANLRETGLAPSTVNGVLAALSSAFTWFVRKRWVAVNPCRNMDDVTVAPATYEWIRTASGIEQLLIACNVNIRNLVAVLVGTGMRLDEALHLHWVDVDFEQRLIHVHRGRRGATKSGHHRHVPINNAVRPVLLAMKLAAGTNTMLWPGAKRGKGGAQLPRDKSSVFRPFKAAALRAGLPKKLRIHDLRHTYASHYMMDGGDIFKLSKLLGHSSVLVTERTYAHLAKDAHAADYGRVSFTMPTTDGGKVLPFATPATSGNLTGG